MNTSSLELQWKLRPVGGMSTERRYLDFVVNGTSLYDLLELGDQVSALGSWPPDFERGHIQQLLSAPGRAALYVCAGCSGLDCGALTVYIERKREGFVWRDFAFGTSYEATKRDLDSCRGAGPFMFNKTEYWQLFNDRLLTLSGVYRRP
jgi:hypothetical protein